jgi:hypothetical protein
MFGSEEIPSIGLFEKDSKLSLEHFFSEREKHFSRWEEGNPPSHLFLHFTGGYSLE